jgi:hypothetical protein
MSLNTILIVAYEPNLEYYTLLTPKLRKSGAIPPPHMCLLGAQESFTFVTIRHVACYRHRVQMQRVLQAGHRQVALFIATCT